jgi:hypothetical protein
MAKITATYNAETKTLSVTNERGETREFPSMTCGANGSGEMAFGVFAVRYPTGSKVWSASVTFWKESGRRVVEAGGYDRGGRSSGAQTIVGWWSDVAEQHRSQVAGR